MKPRIQLAAQRPVPGSQRSPHSPTDVIIMAQILRRSASRFGPGALLREVIAKVICAWHAAEIRREIDALPRERLTGLGPTPPCGAERCTSGERGPIWATNY